MKLQILIFFLFCSFAVSAKRISFEFGIGIGYQPKMQLKQTGSASQNVFKPRGFPSFGLNGAIGYKLNAQNVFGISAGFVTVPFLYTFDLTGTNFAANNPDISKKGNTQGDNLAIDLGIFYRRYLLQRSKMNFFAEVIPTIRLNSSGSLAYSMSVGNSQDSVTVFHVIFKEPKMINLGGRLNIGVKKSLKRNYLILNLFYTRVLPEITGQYFTMINTPDFNYGTLSLINHQFGVAFKFGFGK
jgi:hypothetical protein